jgi:hypothetical protein
MKIYFKMAVSVGYLVANLFILAPWLISQKSDIALGLGIIDLVLLFPTGWYLGKWVAKDIRDALNKGE